MHDVGQVMHFLHYVTGVFCCKSN